MLANEIHNLEAVGQLAPEISLIKDREVGGTGSNLLHQELAVVWRRVQLWLVDY